jgi:hypothetical protein
MFAKLAAIAEAETERLRRWVYVIHALFERHFSEKLMSSKGLPVVGPIELGALMTEGLSLDEHPKRLYSPPDDKELKRFVKFMDNDQDELIDEQELICFCVKGLRQTPEANMAFASRTTNLSPREETRDKSTSALGHSASSVNSANSAAVKPVQLQRSVSTGGSGQHRATIGDGT